MNDNQSTSSPLISIICPVYNTETYLHQCLNSVAKQTYKRWQLVLVDDGSTDSSLSICKQFAENANSSVIVLSKENGGADAARMDGIAVAEGELLLFLDSDDYYLDNRAFEKIAAAYNEGPFDVILFNGYHERVKRSCVDYSWKNGMIDSQDVREVLCSVKNKEGNLCDLGYICIKAIRREYCEFQTNDHLSLYEDRAFFFSVVDKASSYYLINEQMYFYRNTPGSALTEGLTQERLSCVESIDSLTDYYAEKWSLAGSIVYQIKKTRRETLVGFITTACQGRDRGGGSLQGLRLLRESAWYNSVNDPNIGLSPAFALVLRLFEKRRYKTLTCLWKIYALALPLIRRLR